MEVNLQVRRTKHLLRIQLRLLSQSDALPTNGVIGSLEFATFAGLNRSVFLPWLCFPLLFDDEERLPEETCLKAQDHVSD
jgi:hypothetical protein